MTGSVADGDVPFTLPTGWTDAQVQLVAGGGWEAIVAVGRLEWAGATSPSLTTEDLSDASSLLVHEVDTLVAYAERAATSLDGLALLVEDRDDVAPHLAEALRRRSEVEFALTALREAGVTILDDVAESIQVVDDLLGDRAWLLGVAAEAASEVLRMVVPERRGRLWWLGVSEGFPQADPLVLHQVAEWVVAHDEARHAWDVALADASTLAASAAPDAASDPVAQNVVSIRAWIATRSAEDGEGLRVAAADSGADWVELAEVEGAVVSFVRPGWLWLNVPSQMSLAETPGVWLPGGHRMPMRAVQDDPGAYQVEASEQMLDSASLLIRLVLADGVVEIRLPSDS